jgi:hypothetical protein
MSNLQAMAIKKRKAAAKPTVKKRTLNAPQQESEKQRGAPFNDQDIKRRFGRFEGTGEATRRGTRGK